MQSVFTSCEKRLEGNPNYFTELFPLICWRLFGGQQRALVSLLLLCLLPP